MKLDIFKKKVKIVDRKCLEYKTKIIFTNIKTTEVVKISYTTTPIDDVEKLKKIAYQSLATYVNKLRVHNYSYSLGIRCSAFNFTELKIKEYEVNVESI